MLVEDSRLDFEVKKRVMLEEVLSTVALWISGRNNA
jgi:hypothetical protein